ncbi:plasmid pRiA4b ORF-3 family protein [Clostridium estertheticum]|uniref:Plasmid pRiA4b ORF-3 family protein n=1 Tax=Clostridium estertheticum TaxID=238834 RepID=A0AA47IA38_9CLOT|nr:plasmid pRiA4b ORF-3 family protein [Clostridium estertheticum]WAG63114.1 plasmid pRiA4b ORF-3 family protein [Clostridium estertheticum]
MLQIAFDWKNHHLHQFNIFDASGKCVLNTISESEEVYESIDQCEIL